MGRCIKYIRPSCSDGVLRVSPVLIDEQKSSAGMMTWFGPLEAGCYGTPPVGNEDQEEKN